MSWWLVNGKVRKQNEKETKAVLRWIKKISHIFLFSLHHLKLLQSPSEREETAIYQGPSASLTATTKREGLKTRENFGILTKNFHFVRFPCFASPRISSGKEACQPSKLTQITAAETKSSVVLRKWRDYSGKYRRRRSSNVPLAKPDVDLAIIAGKQNIEST